MLANAKLLLSNPQALNAEQEPFYLELLGETSPFVDESFAEVVPAGQSAVQRTSDAPVYEYWWNLGHPGQPKRKRVAFWRGTRGDVPWEKLADPAAHIYVYFPISSGWRVNEFAATLKYLSPVPEQHRGLQSASKDFQAIQPLVGDAASLAGLLPGAGVASKWLGAMANLRLSSLPQDEELNWSVGKVTFGSQRGLMQGVMWTIPRSVFLRLGGRLSGSLAVSFLSARFQAAKGSDECEGAHVIAHAVVYEASGKEWWLPSSGELGRRFIELEVTPQRAEGVPVKVIKAGGGRGNQRQTP